MEYRINIKKKHAYLLALMSALFITTLIVNAFGGNNPAVLGHSAGELIVDGTSVTADSLNGTQINESALNCSAITGNTSLCDSRDDGGLNCTTTVASISPTAIALPDSCVGREGTCTISVMSTTSASPLTRATASYGRVGTTSGGFWIATVSETNGTTPTVTTRVGEQGGTYENIITINRSILNITDDFPGFETIERNVTADFSGQQWRIGVCG